MSERKPLDEGLNRMRWGRLCKGGVNSPPPEDVTEPPPPPLQRIREGRKSKGGVNDPPTKPRPTTRPQAEPPADITQFTTVAPTSCYLCQAAVDPVTVEGNSVDGAPEGSFIQCGECGAVTMRREYGWTDWWKPGIPTPPDSASAAPPPPTTVEHCNNCGNPDNPARKCLVPSTLCDECMSPGSRLDCAVVGVVERMKDALPKDAAEHRDVRLVSLGEVLDWIDELENKP